MNTHNLCFEQKYEKYQSFLSEFFQFLEVTFSIYLNRRVFVMRLKVFVDYTEHMIKEPTESISLSIRGVVKEVYLFL